MPTYLSYNIERAINSFFNEYEPERLTDKNGKYAGYKLATYTEFRDTIVSQEAQIKELQAKIKEIEEKMRNNSNTGSVSTAQTFVTANSVGGKRKTQKKRRIQNKKY
jgi:hypothetical protein